ncbi:MAG: hypothetical protein ACLFS5_02290 [Spirochaetaceae bacterium]
MARYVLAIALIIALTACGESPFLTPELSEDEELEITTVDEGAVLDGGASVPIEVSRRRTDGAESEPFDAVAVELRDGDDTVVRDRQVETAVLAAGDIPPFDLDDPEPGVYRLLVTARRGGRVVSEHERTIFILEDADVYEITSISVHPPALAPQRKGVAEARVSLPEAVPVWLRWTLDEQTIAEGYLEDGLRQLALEAPAERGAHTLTLGLYPYGPPPTGYDGPAPIRRSSRLLVAGDEEKREPHLGPRESYFALFRFDGTTADDGVAAELTDAEHLEAELIGKPRLRVSDRLFGYELDGRSGFEVPRLLLPARGETLSAFSINLRLRADDLDHGQQILEMEEYGGAGGGDTGSAGAGSGGAGGGMGLSLHVGGEDAVTLELRSAGEQGLSRPDVPILAEGEPVDLSIAVTPGAEETTVRWYAGERFVSESRIAVGFPPPEQGAPWRRPAGTTRIGGGFADGDIAGFEGIIDEFGIYFRDEDGRPGVYSDMYRDARRREHGSALIYAQGFDRDGIPAELEAHGEVRSEPGVAVLEPEARLVLPAVPVGNEPVVLEVELREETVREADTDAVYLDIGDGERRLVRVGSSGAFTDHSGRSAELDLDGRIKVAVSGRGEDLVVSAADTSYRVPFPQETSPRELVVQLAVPAAGQAVPLESVLMYQEAAR